MPEIPKTLIVVGGGVIGVEYTCMFAALGVRVILVESGPGFWNSPIRKWWRRSPTICAIIA
jgi:pyruvate/2-oxoglutarate dehydrogenase complex dihydrolipoamide dehydrogenase (E3) component